jgi:hypothetical protein
MPPPPFEPPPPPPPFVIFLCDIAGYANSDKVAVARTKLRDKFFILQSKPWYLGPVPTYRVNKHKDRRDIRQQAADRRKTASGSVDREHKTEISKQKERK